MLPYSESLVIIPTYNEMGNIEKMINTVFTLYPEINLLFVDDGSPDEAKCGPLREPCAR